MTNNCGELSLTTLPSDVVRIILRMVPPEEIDTMRLVSNYSVLLIHHYLPQISRVWNFLVLEFLRRSRSKLPYIECFLLNNENPPKLSIVVQNRFLHYFGLKSPVADRVELNPV